MPPPPGVDDSAEAARWRRLRALYCGLIELVDDQVGVIMDALQRSGRRESTVVLFCTDHGDMIGDLGRNHKSVWHDPSCRTPLTVVGPGSAGPVPAVAAGRTVDAMVQSVDLACTVLDIAGCDAARSLPQTPGRSFWPAAAGAETGHREWAYAECGVGPRQWRMVADREWKYVWHASDGEMLFHRTEDSHDAFDLSATPGTPMDLMRTRLVESMAGCVAPNTVPSRTTGEF
jgi:choline-sulfatase